MARPSKATQQLDRVALLACQLTSHQVAPKRRLSPCSAPARPRVRDHGGAAQPRPLQRLPLSRRHPPRPSSLANRCPGAATGLVRRLPRRTRELRAEALGGSPPRAVRGQARRWPRRGDRRRWRRHARAAPGGALGRRGGLHTLALPPPLRAGPCCELETQISSVSVFFMFPNRSAFIFRCEFLLGTMQVL